jgi:hypothetical protein
MIHKIVNGLFVLLFAFLLAVAVLSTISIIEAHATSLSASAATKPRDGDVAAGTLLVKINGRRSSLLGLNSPPGPLDQLAAPYADSAWLVEGTKA